MNFHNASFKAAYGTSEQLPASTGPEVSFAGRSNVGKSSLLNKLMYRKGLAKVSSTPGKTATINFYDVDGHDLVAPINLTFGCCHRCGLDRSETAFRIQDIASFA